MGKIVHFDGKIFFYNFLVIWRCVVTVAPVLKLELGEKMNPEDIEEGDDVYFECKITANPQAYKVEWSHNVSSSCYLFFSIIFIPLFLRI